MAILDTRPLARPQAPREPRLQDLRRDLVGALPFTTMDGCLVHLTGEAEALRVIEDAAARRGGRPVGVVSVNLDHVHHFGISRRAARGLTAANMGETVEWLNLIDGSPIAMRASRMTGGPCIKLSGSDLVGPVLSRAEATGRSVAIVGGDPAVSTALRGALARRWPALRLAGHWTPSPEDLADAESARAVAVEVRAAGADIVIVCLGKPRQERWIADHGVATGAGALLAFGAVVDFLAGRVVRAPRIVSRLGMEWAWRLMLEPRRLARRYLIQGPPAMLALRR